MTKFDGLMLLFLGILLGILLYKLGKGIAEVITYNLEKRMNDLAEKRIHGWDKFYSVTDRVIQLENRNNVITKSVNQTYSVFDARIKKLEKLCAPKEGGCCDKKAD